MEKNTITDTNKITEIILQNKKDLAFIIGNGINRFFNSNILAWKDLLCSLWLEIIGVRIIDIPKGLGLTEFVDILELKSWNSTKPGRNSNQYLVQKKIQALLQEIKPNTNENPLLMKIQNLDIPILTPNFDILMEKTLELEFHKLNSTGFTDFYPWECYYAPQKLTNPLDGFGIWHLNGMIKYFRSIKISMTQYMGNVERARKWIHAGSENSLFKGKNQQNWIGRNSWLHIIFNKSLFIFGFGLEETELFFRWLLIERAKYFKTFPERSKNGWYLCVENVKEPPNFGRDFFLENSGFSILKVPQYENIYEDVWKNL